MSYERRRKKWRGPRWHLEGVRGCGGGGADGERGAGGHGKSAVRVVALGDTGDSDEFRGGNTGHRSAKSDRKAFEAAMEWLFNPESNPDAWMLDGVVTRDWAGRYIR